MALDRKYRFRNASRIPLVLKKGVRTKTPFFRLFALENTTGNIEIAVIISRKTAKKSVERNQIRRRFQASLSQVFSDKDAVLPLSGMFLFFPYPQICDIPFSELCATIESTLLSVLKKHSISSS